MKKISQFLCMALILVMMLSMVAGISVKASETDSGVLAAETEPTTESITTAPEETEPSLEDATIVTVPILSDELPLKDSALLSTRATYDNGKYRQKAVIWTVNGESVEYTYNGKDNNYNQLLMHTLWYKDEWRAAYCIEPGKTVFVNSDYDEEENSGVDPWGQLPFAKQRGVSLTLLYGYPNGLDSDDLKTQIAYQLATYLIVHEIILGWRQDVHPFARTNDHYFDVFGGGTPDAPESLQITSEFYSSVHEKYLNSEDIWYAYNYISDKLATHDLVPSFSNKLKAQAPTHTMKSNGDGTYSITLTDTNNILASYDFTNTDDLKFKKSSDGKSLTITTSNKTLGTTTVSPTRNLPSVDNSAFLIWNSESDSQELCSLKAASDDPVPAYFKLKLPTGNLEIQKETSDGSCLIGWKFNIYSDKACTQLISGPHTTNPTGQSSVSGLMAGTYWIKEIGNTSDDVTAMYECADNPQKVTISAGETVTVTFQNKLIPKGSLKITKTTENGENIIGWRFCLYADKACENLLYGPHTTNPNGIATFTDLTPGTYWVKEIDNTSDEISAMYECADNPQQVTISAGETATVTFQNNLIPTKGSLKIIKTTDNGENIIGWRFCLYEDKACKNLLYGPKSTNPNGITTFTDLTPGTYWVKEISNTSDEISAMYECADNPQKVTISGSETASVTFFNKLIPKGSLKITKATDTGENIIGWRFCLYADEACEKLLDGPHATNPNGIATFTDLTPGIYWVKEISNTSDEISAMYECADNPQKVTISGSETVTVTFFNKLIPKGSLKITKTTDTGENIMGWRFCLYADEACEKLLDGPHATDPNGIATFTDLTPGTYWVKEVGTNTPSIAEIYECTSQNPQRITIVSDETAKVAFHNKMKTCAITIYKTGPYDSPLSGAQFLLEYSSSGTNWKPVVYSTKPGLGRCTTTGLQNGILVTDDSGYISFQGLYPNIYYRLTEVKAPNGYQLLEDHAFQGKLTTDDTVVTFHIVNSPVFTLPHTGSRSMIGMSAGLALCLLTCVGAVIYLKKKEF